PITNIEERKSISIFPSFSFNNFLIILIILGRNSPINNMKNPMHNPRMFPIFTTLKSKSK
ncbi:MAG: hypothetical protein SPE03_13485, partial [Treponema sp.]|nr:hypothetical protein [Treponema sp.]